jgi:uncharacterized membrane protein YfcA
MTFELLVANVIVGFAGFVQTTTGIGFAMVAVPMLVLIDLSYAPGPALFAMLFLSVAMVAGSWQNVDRQGFSTLFPGLLVGTLVGSQLLGLLSATAFGLVFGFIVLASLALGQMGFAPERTPAANATGGFVSGMMGTVSGIHGPPLAVLYQRAEMATARATMAFVFVFASILSLVSLHLNGFFGREEALAGLALVPGLAVGFAVAISGRRFISDGIARKAMLAIAAISAVVLIVRSVL